MRKKGDDQKRKEMERWKKRKGMGNIEWREESGDERARSRLELGFVP